ncbi:hypothetical protein RV134_350501 [Roseovarius sp. EC-HK134]|nr:hypothetical protein RV420_410070 [Roseovarius sp. EC-SD190]VVT30415.1 hypothetical protein RV134_350501 [Roseovarius sp. EC-HK134]
MSAFLVRETSKRCHVPHWCVAFVRCDGRNGQQKNKQRGPDGRRNNQSRHTRARRAVGPDRDSVRDRAGQCATTGGAFWSRYS